MFDEANIFLKPNDPLLLKIAPEVPAAHVGSPEVQQDIERMLNVAYGEQTDRTKPVLVGLAATQIGILRRVILVDVSAEGHGKVGDLRVYINPEIVWRSKETDEWYEGCFSTGRVNGVVARPDKVRVKALTTYGDEVVEDYSGYTARIFQHEIDHLDGIEFVSRITDDDKLHWVEDNEYPDYRDSEHWRNWPKKCSREEWHKIKGIYPDAGKVIS